MKKFIAFAMIVLSVSLVFAEGTKEDAARMKAAKNEVTVYAYDAFCGDWGPGAAVKEAFEAKTGITLNLVSAGGAIEMLSKIQMEGDRCPADVVLGITDDFAYRAYGLLQPYEPEALKDIPDELEFDSQHRLLPFDYGVFSFVYDSESSVRRPESLMDLTAEEYKGKVILIDPRTSSVGLGLLLWTYNQFGENYMDWWKAMKDNALAIASGWSAAYGLFTEGEAPLVLSYTTSPVYHVMYEDTARYEAVIFPEGHESMLEGMGILKNAKNVENAKAFIDFILSDAQLDIAIANSMYPVNGAVDLPEAFNYAPKPAIMYPSGEVSPEKTAELLDTWTKVMVGL